MQIVSRQERQKKDNGKNEGAELAGDGRAKGIGGKVGNSCFQQITSSCLWSNFTIQ